MKIKNNAAALGVSNNIKKNNKASASLLKKLSSGYSINNASDNASGLAVSEKMRAQIRGMEQASNNATDAVNLIQTAEGYMSEVNNILQRMRELCVQSANGTYDTGIRGQSVLTNSAGDRAKINEEIQQLTDEIDRIAKVATFNGKKISGGVFAFQVGANTQTKYYSNARYSEFKHKGEVFDTLNSSGHYLNLDDIDTKINDLYTAYTDARTARLTEKAIITPMYNAAVTVGYKDLKNYRSELNTVNYKLNLNPTDTTLQTKKTELEGKISLLESKQDIIDYENRKPIYYNLYVTEHNALEEYESILKARDILNTGYCFNHDKFYWGGEKMGTQNAEVIAFTLDKFDSYSLGIAPGPNGSFTYGPGSGTIYGTVEDEALDGGTGYRSAVDVTVQAYANQSIQFIDKAINQVTKQRAFLGAVQNRLEYTIDNLTTSIENTTSSESAIRDTDMVSSMTEYTKNKVLDNAATAMMAQANTLPQIVLRLLQ